jgi:nucleotide-binding universal stress UspA family protein
VAAYLAGVAETLRERGVPRVFWSVWHAPPGRAICRAAVQNAVDLIVLGAHGRGGGRLPLGGVAEHVVREASAPVLLLADAVVPVSADGGLPAPLDARRLRRRSSRW